MADPIILLAEKERRNLLKKRYFCRNFNLFKMIRLEICANGIASLRNAMEGCAQCVELCESLEVGGLTPSFGTLAKAADIAFIPVRVLIRPRPGNYIYNAEETEIMVNDIMLCKKLGFEGVVIGALDKNGIPDRGTLQALMQAGEGMKFTFHRAIDACPHPMEAMTALIDMGFDKVLTSGGQPSAFEGMAQISEMQQRFGTQIAIMAGGGINIGNIMEIIAATGVTNCHASLSHHVSRNNDTLYPKQTDPTGAQMVWLESNKELIYEMEKMINP